MSKNKFDYANKNTLPERVDDADVTVQISLKIEGDLLKALRTRAKALDKPYQTLLKQILRRELAVGGINEAPSFIERLEALEEAVHSLSKSSARMVAAGPKRQRKGVKKVG